MSDPHILYLDSVIAHINKRPQVELYRMHIVSIR